MKIRLEEGINSIYGKMLEELKSQTKEASYHRARKFDEEITKNIHTSIFRKRIEHTQENPPIQKSLLPPTGKVTKYIRKPFMVMKFRRFIQRMLEKLF